MSDLGTVARSEVGAVPWASPQPVGSVLTLVVGARVELPCGHPAGVSRALEHHFLEGNPCRCQPCWERRTGSPAFPFGSLTLPPQTPVPALCRGGRGALGAFLPGAAWEQAQGHRTPGRPGHSRKGQEEATQGPSGHKAGLRGQSHPEDIPPDLGPPPLQNQTPIFPVTPAVDALPGTHDADLGTWSVSQGRAPPSSKQVGMGLQSSWGP